MSRYGETRIRYLNVDEMMLKIAEMRRQKAADESRPIKFPEYVSHFEAWAAGEPGQSDRTSAEEKPDLLGRQGLPEAVQETPDDGLAAPIGFPAAVSTPVVAATEHDHTPKPGFLVRWGFERKAVGLAALGILALTLGGMAVEIVSNQRVPTFAYASNLEAGTPTPNEPVDQDLIPDFVVLPETPPAPRPRPKIPPEQLEQYVRSTLAAHGFSDIGVSASHRGEVFLAGHVYSMDEANDVVGAAKEAPHVKQVFFLHPEVRQPQGPVFFGATASYAPDIWGAKVTRIALGSPADKAGIRPGDVIREFDHATVGNAEELEKVVASHKPGERVAIRLWRDGSSANVVARLSDLTQVASR